MEYNGKTYTLTPEESAQWDQAEKKYKAELRRAAGFPNDQRDKMRKGAGQRLAARRREILKKPTEREAAKQKKRTEGNFSGKRVSLDGKNGKVVGNAFGKVIVQFDDGTRQAVEPERLKPPVEAPAGAPETPTTPTTPPPTEPPAASIGAAPKEETASSALPSAEEFEALMNERLNALEEAEGAPPSPRGTGTGKSGTSTTSKPTVSEASEQAAADLENAARKLGAAIREILKTATPKPGSLSMAAGGVPINLDPEAYRRLKPYLEEALNATLQAGHSTAKVVDALIAVLREKVGLTLAEIRNAMPYIMFYYRTEMLGEKLELPSPPASSQAPAGEKDYSNWRELRKTETDPEEIRARQEFNKERRRVEHDDDEKGARGYLSYLSYQTERIKPGEAADSRPPALGEHPQLREALDLGPMPPYRLDERGPVNPEWQQGIRDSTNAIADELFGDKRLSQAQPWTFEQAWDQLVELIEEIGQEVDPTLKLAWGRTTQGYIDHANKIEGLLSDPRYKQIVKDLYESAEARTLTKNQLDTSKKTLVELALSYELSENWATGLFKKLRANVSQINDRPEPGNGGIDRTGVEADSERDSLGDGRESDISTPTRLGQIQGASEEDQAMWKEISTTGRKAGGSAAIKEKYGEKGAWAILVSQKIDDIMAEADERQTIIKECV